MTASIVERRNMKVRTKAAARRRSRRVLLELLESRTLLTAAAVDDLYRLVQGQPFQATSGGVLANDVIASGNALTVTGNTAPAHGTLVLNADGSFTFTPAAGYSGPDTFDYTISDGLGGVDTGTVTLDIVQTSASQASIDAGPRLASVDSTQGALLNGVLGGLLGTSLNLSALDWNALAGGNVGATGFLNALQANLGVATTAEALTTDATLFQVIDAAADAARAEGSTATANALDVLASNVSGLTGTIQVGDLLAVNPNDGSLADVDLNALDLATGGIQLFNFENVLTTNAPITISGASLGLGSILGSVTLSAQVVEPPVHVVGPAGTTFHTAATRLRLDLDLVDAGLDLSALEAALLGPLETIVGDAVAVDASATVGQLSLYVEVASGDGTLSLINAVSNAVTIQGTPGVADVFIGTVPDALFFNRAATITAADVTPVTVGDLSIDVTSAALPTPIEASTGIGLRALALGQAPLTGSLTYNGPFPQAQTFGSSATFLTNLLNTLTTNLEVTTTGTLGGTLDGLLNSVILPTLTPIVTGVVSPVLGEVLTGLVDPALNALGVGLGEMDVVVAPLIPAVPPQANADFVQTNEDAAVVIPVLGNDAATSAGAPFVVSATQPAHGSVVVNPDGTITYTPVANYFGQDSFTYTISGPGGGTTTATVTLQVLAVNDPPVAVADSYTALANQPLVVAGPGVLSNDSDPDGDPLTAAVVTNPTHGTLTLNPNGSFTYTPIAGYRGIDSFTYRASDGTAFSAPVAVTILVGAINGPPVATPDSYSALEDQPLVVAGPGVLGNDSDPDGDPLTAVLVAGPTNGALTLNPNGSFTYTPFPNFNGTDTFTYQASDGTVMSAPVAVTINVAPVNDVPVANPDAYAVEGGRTLTVGLGGVLANDVDPDGDVLTAFVVSGPAHGTLTLNPNGSFTYTPTPGYSGPDSFTYRAFDGAASSAPALVSLLVTPAGTPVGSAPVAAPDSYSIAKNSPLNVPGPGVLANDVDPDGTPLGAMLVAGPTHGSISFNVDGSFTYIPFPNYVGPDSFTYQAGDGVLFSSPTLVTINVTAVNDAPTANPDSYQMPEGGVLIISGHGVLENDVDPDGPGLSSVIVSGPSHGTVTLNSDGSFTYIPTPGYVGRDTFYYQATDGSLGSIPVPVTISVLAAADATPRLLTVQRYGFHVQPTRVVITFSTNLDPISAQNVANYEIIGPGRDGRLGTRDDVRYVIASATYDPATRSVTLAPTQQLYLYSTYQLTVRDGLTSSAGLVLDGDNDGVPGGTAVVRFDKSSLAGPVNTPPTGPRTPVVNRGPAFLRGRPAPRIVSRPNPAAAAFLAQHRTPQPMLRPRLASAALLNRMR